MIKLSRRFFLLLFGLNLQLHKMANRQNSPGQKRTLLISSGTHKNKKEMVK